MSTSQPVPALPSQSPKPAPHVSPQRPATHVRVELGPEGHTFPHAPQCNGSVCVAVHTLAHRVWSGAHPEMHDGAPPAVEHSGRSVGHTRPHAPHAPAVSSEVSQPFDGSPSQSPKPGLHAIPHEPAAHVADALARAGHPRPQPPQCAALVRRLISHPFNSRRSQSPNPVSHVVRHVLDTHVALAFAPARHALPHAPQCAALTCVFTSHPFDTLPSQSPKPAAHVVPHTPRVHVRVVLLGPGHPLPHAPQ